MQNTLPQDRYVYVLLLPSFLLMFDRISRPFGGLFNIGNNVDVVDNLYIIHMIFTSTVSIHYINSTTQPALREAHTCQTIIRI